MQRGSWVSLALPCATSLQKLFSVPKSKERRNEDEFDATSIMSVDVSPHPALGEDTPRRCGLAITVGIGLKK